MSEVRLQVKNLCKNFGITKAVQNVSFNVNKGEVHALSLIHISEPTRQHC